MNIRESKPFTTYQVTPIFNDGRPHGTDWPNAESEEKARLIAQQYLRDWPRVHEVRISRVTTWRVTRED